MYLSVSSFTHWQKIKEIWLYSFQPNVMIIYTWILSGIKKQHFFNVLKSCQLIYQLIKNILHDICEHMSFVFSFSRSWSKPYFSCFYWSFHLRFTFLHFWQCLMKMKSFQPFNYLFLNIVTLPRIILWPKWKTAVRNLACPNAFHNEM